MEHIVRFSINKELFENVLSKKIVILKKNITNYWRNELLEPKIVDDKLSFDVKKFEKLVISNGFGKTKPQLVVECLELSYYEEKGIFEFHLGKIIEQKNITVDEEIKDNVIKQLMEENDQLKEKVRMIQQKMDFK